MNLGADLLDPQSWNAYAYVRNNPLALVDPSGMDAIDSMNDCLSNLSACSSQNPGMYAQFVNANFYNGDDPLQPGCTIDGAPISCNVAANFSSDAVAYCPNNECTTYGIDPYTQKPAFLQFYAGAGGSKGYLSQFDWTQGVNEWYGGFLSDQEYQQQVIQPYINGMQSKLAAVLGINAALSCANSLEGGNLNCSVDQGTLKEYLQNNICLVSRTAARCNGPGYSLHFRFGNQNGITVHMDSANPGFFPFQIQFPGLLIHFAIDVIGGNTIFSTGVPHP
jgi:hypothetical protein